MDKKSSKQHQTMTIGVSCAGRDGRNAANSDTSYLAGNVKIISKPYINNKKNEGIASDSYSFHTKQTLLYLH